MPISVKQTLWRLDSSSFFFYQIRKIELWLIISKLWKSPFRIRTKIISGNFFVWFCGARSHLVCNSLCYSMVNSVVVQRGWRRTLCRSWRVCSRWLAEGLSWRTAVSKCYSQYYPFVVNPFFLLAFVSLEICRNRYRTCCRSWDRT